MWNAVMEQYVMLFCVKFCAIKCERQNFFEKNLLTLISMYKIDSMLS